MGRDYAAIKLTLHLDDDWRERQRDAQHLYFTLMTLPRLSYCGVYEWNPKHLAVLSKGWSVADVLAAARELVEHRYIVIDQSTDEMLIRSYVRNDGLMKNPRMAVSMAKAFLGTVSTPIRSVIVHELKRLHRESPEWAAWDKPQVQEILRRKSTPAADLPLLSLAFGDELPHAFTGQLTPNAGEGYPSAEGSPTPFTLHHSPSTLHHTPRKPRKPTPPPAPSREFDAFWEVYPKKVAKQAAAKAFAKATKANDVELILSGARRYSVDPNLPERQFIPDPATWLNAGRWTDEPLAPRVSDTARPSVTDQRMSQAHEAGQRLKAQRQTQLPSATREIEAS